MGDGTLDSTMRICIEGPDHLSSDILEQILDYYKAIKIRKTSL